jgi:hypothetical protein
MLQTLYLDQLWLPRLGQRRGQVVTVGVSMSICLSIFFKFFSFCWNLLVIGNTITKHYPGSVSDFTIFTQNVDKYKALLKKDSSELTLPDHGVLKSRFPEMWGLLADKGYQGADALIRAYVPKKKKKKKKGNEKAIQPNG